MRGPEAMPPIRLPKRAPRLRFTLRSLIVAVAIVGLLVWYAQRHARYSRLAIEHESRIGVVMAGSLLKGMEGHDSRCRPTTDWESAMHREIAAKFRHVAPYPWLPIAPDPDSETYRWAYYERVHREYYEKQGLIPPTRLRDAETTIISISPKDVPDDLNGKP